LSYKRRSSKQYSVKRRSPTPRIRRSSPFEFDVGVGCTGSGYPIRYSVWFRFPGEKGFRDSFGLGSVDWTWVSSRKTLGKLKVDLPEGTIVKQYTLYRKNPEWTFKVVKDGKLEEIPVEEKDEVIGKIGNHEVVARYFVNPEYNIKEFKVGFVKGPLGNKFAPRFTLEETRKLLEELKKTVGHQEARYWAGFIQIEGDTYPIREKLKRLGFKYGFGEWKRDVKDLSPNELRKFVKKLREEGINTEHITTHNYIEHKYLYEREKAKREFEEYLTGKTREKLGVEPRRVRVEKIDREGTVLVAAKLPFLGRERYKEIVNKEDVEYHSGHFYIKLKVPKKKVEKVMNLFVI